MRSRVALYKGDKIHHKNSSSLLQELEEDPEMRSRVALYKDPAHKPAAAQQQADAMTDGYEDEDDLPEIPLDELLDDMNALQLEGGPPAGADDEDEDMEE